MFDMHTHILPEVDDGAKTLDEALDMLKQQFKQGVTKIVLTPHVQNKVQKKSSSEYLARFNQFKEIAYKAFPSIKLFLGTEVMYDQFKHPDYDKFIFKGFKHKYLLIEFSVESETPIVDILYDLIAKGYQPIVAHIERYAYLSLDDVRRIKQEGSLIQVNSGGLLGNDGKVFKKLAHLYLKEDLVDFIASDCHNASSRGPNLLKALSKVPKTFKMKELEESV